MPQDCICFTENPYDKKCVFESKHDMNQALTNLCYGDLYIIGRLWISALKSVLVGSSMCLIPSVHAAPPPEPEVPKKPPKMKYSELPIYESPHRDYQCYFEEESVCPEYHDRMLHNFLLPQVSTCRKQLAKTGCDFHCYMVKLKNDFCGTLTTSKNDLKKYMRDPENLQTRQAVVASGILTGLLLGRTVPRRLFLATLGALATGALCFPKETDEGFRTALFYSGQGVIALYGLACNRNVMFMKEKVACPPPPPPPK